MIHVKALQLGYGSLLSELEQSVRLQRLPHALLFLGPSGVGKRTLCDAMAHFLLGGFSSFEDMQEELTPSHALVRHLSQRTHPEGMVLSSGASIDEVRSVIHRLGHTSFTDTWRVVLIPQVDQLSLNSVNALLKSIESPPPRTLFLLTAAGPVLKTLFSRCLVYTLHPLSSARFEETLQTMPFTFPQDPLFYWISQGCVGRAVALVDHFSWARKSWDLFIHSARGACLLPQEWLTSTLELFSLWQELLVLWTHKMALYSQQHGFFLHFLGWTETLRVLLKDKEVYHTDAALTVQAVYAKITGFFLENHVSLPDNTYLLCE